MRSLIVFKVMIIVIIILELFALIVSNNNYCQKICRNYRYCNRMCSERARNQSTDTISLPHCGLTQLNRRAVGVHSRIVFGKESKEHRHPWMVSVEVTTRDPPTKLAAGIGLPQCGGAIINSRFILTAAHCCTLSHLKKNNTVYQILMGTNNQDIFMDRNKRIISRIESVSENMTVIMHEKFMFEFRVNSTKISHYTFPLNDICLMKTTKPIEFVVKDNKFVVNSICLPEKNSEQYGEVMIAGWGDTTPPENYSSPLTAKRPYLLQEDKYILLNKQTCGLIHRSIGPSTEGWPYLNITDKRPFDNKTQLCTVYKSQPVNIFGVGQGDSGSPVIQYDSNRAYVVGVAAWIGPYSIAKHMQVSKYMDWIENTINKYS